MTDGLGRPQTVAAFGGNSDIARATLRRLRPRRVVLAVRDPATTGEPAFDIAAGGAPASGAEVHAVAFDADSPDTHAAAVAEAARHLGDIDVALVAFGVLGDQEQAERDPLAAAALARTNMVGGVSLLVALAEHMRAQGHGAIVVLSSVAAERPRRSNFAYGASKAGLDAFAQGLGDALRPDGVHVLVVRPGFVRTKMTRGLEPAPLATDADAVARAIESGLRSRAHTVWAPPALRWVFAALRHLPRPVFRRLNL
jgi:decaprenylphospho-beta-D-erythro-pentofuranosid-2-ulose 2-reductase